MYNNDNGKLKGYYLFNIPFLYVFVNGAYCKYEIQIGTVNKNICIQLFCRDKAVNVYHYTIG